MSDIPVPPHQVSQEFDDLNDITVAGHSKLPSYKKNYSEEVSGYSVVWLTSFTDIMGLMLTFFVLLFAMSEIDRKEVAPNLDGQPLQEMSKFVGPPDNAGPVDSISLNRMDFNKSLDLGYLKSVLESLSESTPILKKVTIVPDEKNKRLIVTLPHDLLFQQGQSQLTPEGLIAVKAMTGVLKHIRNGVEIVGHADPVKATKGGASNWEISLARAVAVAGVLSAEGYPRNLPVKGYSSGLYEQFPKTMPEEQRLALSRRVDIIINVHDGSQTQRFGIGDQ